MRLKTKPNSQIKNRIKRFLHNELKELGINSKIVGITTDNAADIKSATTSGFGVRFSCVAHNSNFILKPVVSHKKCE